MTASVNVPRQLPLIVRIAGLDVEALAAFQASRLPSLLDSLSDLEAQLGVARQELVDHLFGAIHGAEKEHRRGLLAVKRDCFNGRPLARWQQRPEWPLIESVAASHVQAVLAHEARRQELIEALQAALSEQLQREEDGLLKLAQDATFLRGLGLSSLVLAQTLEKLAAGGRLKGKRRRRLFTSLLRYATRASLKLSPFSTLTPVGLAQLTEGAPQNDGRLLAASDWQTESGVWLYRYFLDQLVDLLSAHPTFRSGLGLRLNDTLEALPDGRLRFLRPRCWEAGKGDDEGQLKRRQPALVKVRLTSPVVEFLRNDLAETTRPHAAVVDRVLAAFPERPRDETTGFINRLVDIGVLLAELPWPTGEIDVQRHLLSYLQSLPEDPALTPVLEDLNQLVPLLREFPRCDTPTRSITSSKALAESVGRHALAAGGVDPSVKFFAEPRDHYFTEDVFVTPESGTDGSAAVLTLNAAETESLAVSVSPLARLASCHSLNADYLLSLADLGRELWPSRDRVPFLDFFEATQPIYQEFIRFQRTSRRTSAPREFSFNPRGLEEITQFETSRRHIASGLKHCFQETEEGWELGHVAVSELLDSLPPSLAACRDFNAFLQPYEDGGRRRWVLNDLFEGAGRMSSRYSTAMPESVKERWSESLSAHSSLGLLGRPVEIVDLFCPEGHTLNVHSPQTRRTLVLPGESLDLDPERQLRLRDLWIHLDSPPFPVLTDSEGQPLAPLHLGGVIVRYMPSLFKFLTFFGTTELMYRIPTTKSYRPHDDIRVLDRHLLGGVVYRRKSWTLDRDKVYPKFADLRGLDLMRAVDSWRRQRLIPDQVFMQEPVDDNLKNPHRKPQFIDFRSPSFVDLFRVILQNNFPTFLLAEALPATHQHPLALDGRRRALEIQVDTFGEVRADVDESEYRRPAMSVLGTGPEPARASRLAFVPNVP